MWILVSYQYLTLSKCPKKQGYERWTFTSLSQFGFLKRPFSYSLSLFLAVHLAFVVPQNNINTFIHRFHVQSKSKSFTVLCAI